MWFSLVSILFACCLAICILIDIPFRFWVEEPEGMEKKMLVSLIRSAFIFCLFITIVLFSGACSDNGSSDFIAESGLQDATPVQSLGSIDGFGSIWVNDTAYAMTDQTEVRLDGQIGYQADLRKGMRVLVNGRKQRNGTAGEAAQVVFNNDADGPIDAVDLEDRCLTLLGRTVVVDAGTVIKDYHASQLDDADDDITPRLTLEDLANNELIEVSGMQASGGELLASRIERKPTLFEPDVTQVEVRGLMSQFDDVALTFQLGNLVVDYAFALTQGNLADGAQVEVRGTLNASHDRLTANTVALEDGALAGVREELVSLEGLITDFTSPGKFELDGMAVDASEAVYVNGLEDDLAVQVGLEVEGYLSGEVLIAEKARFRGTRVQITAPLQKKPTANSLELLGLTISYNGLTEIVDLKGGQTEDASVEASYLEGRLVASRIVYTDTVQSIPIVNLRGPALLNPKYPPTRFFILGLTVLPVQADFKNAAGQQISHAEFFNQLEEGALVFVRGEFDGFDTILAEDVRLMQ